MTNFDRTQDDPIEGLDPQMASDLQELYSAPVPALHFEWSAAPQGGWLSQLLHLTWRPAAAVAAMAVAVATVLVGPSLWSGESQVNAETIFARASAAAQSNAPASGPQAYHLIATTESPGQTGPATTTEVWYVNASHQRTENEYTGDGSPDFGVSVDGADAWMYGDFSGTFRAVHGPASELGMSFASQAPGSNLGEVLSQYSGNCQKAEQDGEDTVAGRAAYRIVVTPDVATCPGIAGEPGKDIGKLGTLIVDVDKETFLPLKTDQQDNGGLPAYTYTVTQIEVGQQIADATFTNAVPEGVTVVDVTGLTQAKNILSGYTIDGTPPEQPSVSPAEDPSKELKPTPAP